MTKHPKPGDRSRRNDDRYLFLEAMLSAREKLYISYMGQSNQDNSLVPPSALVSELMDYIEQGFKIPGRKILDHIMTRHRLQAFSAEYFKKNEKLFSYSHENFEAAQRSREDREAPAPFISCGLSQPEEDWKTVDLDNLCRFFGNPTRFTINRRLGMYLEEMYSTLEDREAFEIKGLEKYVLEQDMMEKRLAGRTLKDLFSSIQASGRLPHGTVGRCIYGVLSQGVEHFVKETESYMLERPLEPLEVDLSISGFRVMGRIDTIYPERLIQYRYGRVSSVDRLKVWIHHLALNSLGADSYPRTSVLVGLDPNNAREPVWAAWECFSVENSQGILGRLLEEYWVGLARPLHFFPQSSWTYVHMLLDKNKTREDALRAARNTWTGSHFKHGECEDPYYQLCFRGTDPLDSEFERIAEEVFGPFLRYQKDLRK